MIVLKILNKKNWFLIFGVIILIFLISGGLIYYFKFYLKQGFTIDPEAEIDPNQEYQVTYWDYRLFIGQDKRYQQFLEEAITEFNQRYPNIKVNYKLLSFLEGPKKLNKSLKAGNPPDVYNDIFGTKLISEELQIPVSLLLDEGDKEKYSPFALKSFSYQEQLWGLPNWIFPRVWLGNKSILDKTSLNLNQLRTTGWTIQEFVQVAKEINNLDKESCIIFNPYNSDLIYQLLRNKQLISPDEDVALAVDSLHNVFKLLDKLRKSKVFPRKPDQMNKKIMSYFLQDKAGIVAPVNSWLLNSFYQQNSQENLTLLPIPKFNSQQDKVTTALVTGLLLFRQQQYKGDDHSKAVYKFAKFINQKKNFYLAKKLRVVPAYLPLQSIWKKEVKLKSEIKQELMTYINQAGYRELSEFRKQDLDPKVEQVIQENYRSYWEDNLASEKVVDQIWRGYKYLIQSKQSKEQ